MLNRVTLTPTNSIGAIGAKTRISIRRVRTATGTGVTKRRGVGIPVPSVSGSQGGVIRQASVGGIHFSVSEPETSTEESASGT